MDYNVREGVKLSKERLDIVREQALLGKFRFFALKLVKNIQMLVSYMYTNSKVGLKTDYGFQNVYIQN